MKKLITIIILILAVAACSEENVTPVTPPTEESGGGNRSCDPAYYDFLIQERLFTIDQIEIIEKYGSGNSFYHRETLHLLNAEILKCRIG